MKNNLFLVFFFLSIFSIAQKDTTNFYSDSSWYEGSDNSIHDNVIRNSKNQKKCYEDSLDHQGYIFSECNSNSKFIDYEQKLMTEPGTGIILYQSSLRPFSGFCQKCFYNGKLEFKMKVTNGKKDGSYLLNYKSGCPQKMGLEIMGIRHSSYREFYDSTESLKLDQHFNNGKLDGKQLSFSEKGDTIALENYKLDVLNGLQRSYFFNGKLNLQITYKSGKMHGKYLKYDSKGTLLDDITYNNGKRHKKAYRYFDNGNLMIEESWNHGKKNGEFKYFFPSGTMSSYEIYVNDKKEGEFEEKYKNGFTKRHAVYKKDKLICETIYNEYGEKIKETKEGSKEDKKKKKEN